MTGLQFIFLFYYLDPLGFGVPVGFGVELGFGVPVGFGVDINYIFLSLEIYITQK